MWLFVVRVLGFALGYLLADAVCRLIFPKKPNIYEDCYADDLDILQTEVPVVKIKRLHPDAKVPAYAKPGDAGADLVSIEEVTLVEGEHRLVRCGFAMELPAGWEAQVRSRSGLALKNGVVVLNSPGTIDEGYRGEVGAILMNHGPEQTLKKGTRIAQMVLSRAPQGIYQLSAELSETERGTGGFGSTGVKS